MGGHPNSNRAVLERDAKITRTVKTYNYGGLAGCVTKRRCHETGTIVSVYHNKQAGLDDTAPWSTTCEDHSINVQHDTLKLALYHVSSPLSWCDECRLTARREQEG